MTPEQRIKALEQTNARLMGVLSAHNAILVSLISTHQDRHALGALIEIATDLGLQAGQRQNLPTENLDTFLQVAEGMRAAATGQDSMNVGLARDALQGILKRADGRPR